MRDGKIQYLLAGRSRRSAAWARRHIELALPDECDKRPANSKARYATKLRPCGQEIVRRHFRLGTSEAPKHVHMASLSD